MFIRSSPIAVICLVAAVLIFAEVESHEHRQVAWLNSRPNAIPIANAPWVAQIKLDLDDKFVCSGAIIADQFVVTAARCFDNYEKDELAVVVAEEHVARVRGLEYNTDKPKKRSIEAIYRHPEYRKNGSGHADIAVVKVSTDFNTGRNTKIIPLCKSPLALSTDYITVMGWGHSDVAAPTSSNQLRTGAFTLMSQEECRDKYRGKNREIADTTFCTGTHTRANDCDGDIGSPAIRNRELCGIASWGIGCGSSSQPSVFTSIMDVKDFIVDCMNNRCTE